MVFRDAFRKFVSEEVVPNSGQWIKNVIVPKANILRSPGQGFIYLMQKLAQERITCAISSIASSEYALDQTLAYVMERKAFGKPIGKFQNSRFKMAEMKTEITIGQTFVDTLVANHLKGDVTPDEGVWQSTGHRNY